jgi:ubiquinone/menaquinone biosynthesis C-methylase UbiE
MQPPTFGQRDLWQGMVAADDARARQLAATLEARAQRPDEQAVRRGYLDLLNLQSGERVLEVGCGSGAVLREIASRVGPTGTAVGLDPSPALLAVARELAAQAGVAERLELREGDARALPFPDAEFDVSLAVTALLHIPQAERVIAELVRVVRPGGRVGVLERDDESRIIAHPDRELTRRILTAMADQATVDTWVGRRCPQLLARAGLSDVQIQSFTVFERDHPGSWSRARLEVAREVGAVTPEEWDRWLAALDREAEDGSFLGLTYLFIWGTRR